MNVRSKVSSSDVFDAFQALAASKSITHSYDSGVIMRRGIYMSTIEAYFKQNKDNQAALSIKNDKGQSLLQWASSMDMADIVRQINTVLGVKAADLASSDDMESLEAPMAKPISAIKKGRSQLAISQPLPELYARPQRASLFRSAKSSSEDSQEFVEDERLQFSLEPA